MILTIIVIVVPPSSSPPFRWITPTLHLLFTSSTPLVPLEYGEPPPPRTTLWGGAYNHPPLGRIYPPPLFLALALVVVATFWASQKMTPRRLLIFWPRWWYPPSPPLLLLLLPLLGHCLYLVDWITCLQTLQGDYHVFVITVKKCKFSILKLLPLWFNRSCRYLYPLRILSFCWIYDSECYREIIENSGTPFWKVSALYYNYDYYGSIYLTNFILMNYFFFHAWICFQYKK